MANHTIENIFSEVLRKIEVQDPVHADINNPLFKQLINNDAYLNNHTVKKFDSVAALTVAAGLKANMLVTTAGFYLAGDGGNSLYVIVPTAGAADGASLVTITGSPGLQAKLLTTAVNYRQFGAKGDGINDDAIQIKAAHAYANKNQLPVVNLTGEYWLIKPNSIIIQTPVQWGMTKFHIDEQYNDVGAWRFQVAPSKSSFSISLDAATKASFLSKLKPGVANITELAPYKNHLVRVLDNNDRIGIRKGYEGNTGWAREEFFYVEEHGHIIGDIAWTFNDYTSLIAYPCDENYLEISGGTFYLSGSENPLVPNNGTYLAYGINIYRSRTIIKNQWLGLEPGASDTVMEPLSAFYNYNSVYDVLLENVRLIPREKDRPGTDMDVQEGTYGIGGSRVLKATFRNVTAEGSYVHWGVFGTNLFKDFYIENCKLNRVDVHFHCWNLYVKDSAIGNKGFQLTGGGDLFIENTQRFGNDFVNFRSDYGGKWDGDIRIKDCRLMLDSGTASSKILGFNPSNFDFKYPLVMGRTIKVDGFILDYSQVPHNTAAAWPINLPTFGIITDTGDRVIMPSSVELENIKVVGREKGLRLLYLANPKDLKLPTAGGFEVEGAPLVTNSRWVFRNIDTEYIVEQSQTVNSSHIYLNGTYTQEYLDSYAFYPDILIEDCRYIRLEPKGMIANIRVRNCAINAMDLSEGGGGRSTVKLEDCLIQPDVKDDARTAYFVNTKGVTYINCTVDLPKVNGAYVTDLATFKMHIGPIFTMNVQVLGAHFNTKIAQRVLDFLIANDPTYEGALQEFYEKLGRKGMDETSYVNRRKGTTAQRPNTLNIPTGFVYFDTDLSRNIVWSGTEWVEQNRKTEALSFYTVGGTEATHLGKKITRQEGHPTHEYVMPENGRMESYTTVSDILTVNSNFRWDIYKNGVLFHTPVYGPYTGLNPRKQSLSNSNLTFVRGDRISVVATEVRSDINPAAVTQLELYVSYDK